MPVRKRHVAKRTRHAIAGLVVLSLVLMSCQPAARDGSSAGSVQAAPEVANEAGQAAVETAVPTADRRSSRKRC
jgi:hypothetical protein